MRDKNILVVIILMVAVLLGIALMPSLQKALTGESVTGVAATGVAISEGRLKGLEVSVIVPEKYQRVQAGEMLQFQISLKNILASGRHDVQLDYYVKKNEIIVAHRRELKAVETQASFLSSIKVPEETLPGIYTVEVQINEEENALATFYVKSSEIGQIRLYLIILIIAILLVGGIISWELHQLVKKGGIRRR